MAKKKKGKDNEDHHSDDDYEFAVANRQMIAGAWEERNRLYEQLFGRYSHVSPASYAAPSREVNRESLIPKDPSKTDTKDPGEPNPEEAHLAVLAYGPDPLRPYWTYVTAGLSTPWLQSAPDEVSGFGCELIIKAPTDAAWPGQILRSMAYYIFNHAGVISPGVRIALNAPIAANTESDLRNLFVWYADEAPDAWYQLPSGGFGLFCAVGITEDECRYAESIEEYGTWCIQEVLRQTGVGQVSDPRRNSIMHRENIKDLLQNVTQFANSFREGGFQ